LKKEIGQLVFALDKSCPHVTPVYQYPRKNSLSGLVLAISRMHAPESERWRTTWLYRKEVHDVVFFFFIHPAGTNMHSLGPIDFDIVSANALLSGHVARVCLQRLMWCFSKKLRKIRPGNIPPLEQGAVAKMNKPKKNYCAYNNKKTMIIIITIIIIIIIIIIKIIKIKIKKKQQQQQQNIFSATVTVPFRGRHNPNISINPNHPKERLQYHVRGGTTLTTLITLLTKKRLEYHVGEA
jgi:hypothetical protein